MTRLPHPRKYFLLSLGLIPFIGCNCDDTNLGQIGTRITATSPVDFGDVLIGQIERRDVEIKNDGDVSVTITRVKIADDFSNNDYMFSIPTGGFSIGPRGTATLEAKFQAFAATGSVSVSSFQILADAVDELGQPVQATVEVRGRGVDQALSIMPNPVDFGTVIIGGSEEREFTVRNLLSNPVDLLLRPGAPGEGAILIRGGNGMFAIVSPIEPDGSLLPAGQKLAPGATATIRARYTPSQMPTTEDDRGRARIAACADQICDQNVDFIGRPSLSGISCTPATIDYGAVNPERRLNREVSCRNEANHPLRITGWVIASGSAPEFTADVYNGVPSELAPGEMFTIKTTFSPTRASLNQGPLNGELTVSAQTIESIPLRDVKIPLTGSAGGPGISVTPSQLSFGNVALGTSSRKRLLVSNVGYTPLSISSVTIGDMVFTTDGAPTSINVGDSVTWVVTYSPVAEVPSNSVLAIDSDDAVTPTFNVPLTGIGVALPPCQYTITPSSLTWGIVAQTTSERLSTRIDNVGTDDCLIGDYEIIPQGGDFHLVNVPAMTFTLTPGMGVDVPIDFSPTREGSQIGEFEFYISDPTNPNPRVALAGTGLPPCGNGQVDGVEECDDGNPFNGDGCDSNCTFSGCGNGIITRGEVCDDGNTISGDGCEYPSCTPTFICGNFNLELGEECDDGNVIALDGCSPFCQIEDCGNGVLDANEQCDDGNRIAGDGCSITCQLDTMPDVDVLTFGQGAMRGTGIGQIVVSGVTGPVSSALLFWNGPTNSSDLAANAIVTFNGNYVTGVNVGFSSDNCWGFANSQAYRADVTQHVTGDGVYTLNDFLKPDADVNGVSLVVFYDDGNPNNNYDIGIYDSNDSNISSPFDPADWNRSFLVDFMLGGQGFMELHVSDGQAFDDGAVLINGNTIVPAGPAFSGDSVPNANPALVASAQGGLWDIHRYDITSTLVGGPQTLNLTSATNADCLSLVLTLTLMSQ